MAELDFIDIAIAPPDVLDASLVEKVAAIINKDLYRTRLQLAGKIPRIVARYQNAEVAEAIVQSLNALGIVAFIYKDSELHKPSAGRFRAHSLKREEGKVTFWDNRSMERSLQTEDVFLVLQGTVQTNIESESTETRMKFSLPRTILIGGLPVWRAVKEKVKNVAVQTVCFIRLYERASMEPSIEILQKNFNYSFLGQKMTSSSLQNLSATAAELRDAFPQAAFDDRLTKSFGESIPFASPDDSIEINCRLIYLYYQAVSSLG
ncbi:MAG: hypothetical protein NTZ34_12320 [Chloroflexi bacterium]|nr:hypothetical protein [Chloroflexota bacterium]